MIRKIEEKDVAEVVRIEEELFADHPWRDADVRYEMEDNPFAEFLVLEEEGKIIGYGDLWIMFDQAQIANIAVDAGEQRRGCGQKLMDEMIRRSIAAECENITLEVRVSNVPAIALYEKNGFIRAAVRKNYYENGEDAWLMILPVGGITI